MRHRFGPRLVAGVLAFGLVGAACSSPAETGELDQTTSEAQTEVEGSPAETEHAPPVDTQAATLTRDLTAALNGHEYLAGSAIAMAVMKGPESAEFEAAAGALDQNSQDLAAAIGSIYGEDAGDQFLKLWRKHIGFFVDYTLAGGNGAKAKKAKNDLDGYRQDFGAFLESAGVLPKSAVADALKPHVQSTLDAIDAVLGSGENPFIQLRVAASHLPHVATALSSGISEDQGFEGEADSAAAELQRDLTYLLTEHEYLAGIAVAMGVMNGTDSAEFKAAATALDENSKALAAAVESIYGEDAGNQFLKLWRKHIGFFVDYTLAGGKGPKAREAKQNLDGYREDFGAFLEGAGTLPKDVVADALTPHVQSTLDAIDAVLGKTKANPFEKLYEAAQHMPHIATALAGGIVEQFPEKF